MKCSKCGGDMTERGIVVTLVQDGATYTATLHPYCMRSIIGVPQARKLESVAFLSGWQQLGLPMFRT